MALVSENRLGKRPLARLKSVLEYNIKMNFKDHKDLRIIFSTRYNIKGMRIRVTLTENQLQLWIIWQERAVVTCIKLGGCYRFFF
jgi:hypothetical protein